MTGVARGFLGAAVIYGIVGLVLGLKMAISHDHDQIPAHAHVNLIGWASFFLFAIFYHSFGEKVSNLLARIHFWLAQISLLGLTVGLYLIYSGQTQFEPLAATSALTYAASFLVFAYTVFRFLFRD
jgi:cbb3-type cytochrome oxidase subunit 1